MKVHYYYPYLAKDGKHKFYIITKTEKKVYFGAAGYSDFTNHKDEARKQRYIKRHENKKIGVNLGYIPLEFGVGGYYGANQQLKKVMRTLKDGFYKKRNDINIYI